MSYPSVFLIANKGFLTKFITLSKYQNYASCCALYEYNHPGYFCCFFSNIFMQFYGYWPLAYHAQIHITTFNFLCKTISCSNNSNSLGFFLIHTRPSIYPQLTLRNSPSYPILKSKTVVSIVSVCLKYFCIISMKELSDWNRIFIAKLLLSLKVSKRLLCA